MQNRKREREVVDDATSRSGMTVRRPMRPVPSSVANGAAVSKTSSRTATVHRERGDVSQETKEPVAKGTMDVESHPPPDPQEPPPLTKEERLWQVKQEQLAMEVAALTSAYAKVDADKELVLDAIELMMCEHEANMTAIQTEMRSCAVAHEADLRGLEQRENACRAAESRAMEKTEQLKRHAVELRIKAEHTQERIVLETESAEQLHEAVKNAQEASLQQQAALNEMLTEEERMRDSAYGLSGEVREMVMAMEKLTQQKREAEVAAMSTEVVRRELYSTCEELKGSIRVYCRVKGRPASQSPPPASESVPSCVAAEVAAEPEPSRTLQEAIALCPSPSREQREGSTRSVASSHTRRPSLTMSSARVGGVVGKGSKMRRRGPQAESGDVDDAMSTTESTSGCSFEEDIFSYPTQNTSDAAAASREQQQKQGAEEVYAGRSLCVHQTRSNATSTGTYGSTECFTYDRVFDATVTQEETYNEMEPLVNNAVDGYRVCVFAYGQTGSGKTYTMEGSLKNEAMYGVTPRAMRTIFNRQEELANEGWKYHLTCSFVEIYNDVIRDLMQSPAVYEAPGGAAAGNSSYHTIKHTADKTTITNVRERQIRNMDEFRSIYQQAIRNRRTARTQLNDRSSRSHCVFTLRIDGANDTIRQRSEGILCLVDLAGSERVNESGVQGQQLKEAININRSLLDLGKCIHAMRSGSVVPWRNSKLTYLLQNHLGAKGGKLLMIVTVSDRREHLPETLNSLRFATRVSETVVGTSVKRISNY